ncbi:MAG: hypothetical protein ACK6CT_13900 [Planctomycetia bacterium]
MTPTPPPAADPPAALRRGMYLLLAAVAVGNISGRLGAVNSVDMIRLERHLNEEARKQAGPEDEPRLRSLQRPFLSGNDRSRWCTVRALVEHGTYAIDEIVVQPGWDTIDMVKHDGRGRPAPGPDEGHLYSSKPPLLATIMAGGYWAVRRLTGKTLGSHPHELGRILLFCWNVLPFVAYLAILARIVERYGRTDFGRAFVFTAAALGTLLSAYAVAFTNHWPAAFAAMVALDALLRIACDGERRRRGFFVAGLALAFVAACELPGLALLGLAGLLLLRLAPRQTLVASLPAALLVAAAACGTNYAAHGTIRPAYTERHVTGGWYDYQFRRGGRVIDSYWKPTIPKSPIDRGEPSPAAYAFHVLVGHHGIFSLTPVWLLSLGGLMLLIGRRDAPAAARGLAVVILACTVACLAFYVMRPLEDRNYGGTATGFRWALWFAPLWLYAMLPAADVLAATRPRRLLAAVLLAVSVASASYPTWNPWTLPWLQVFWTYCTGG